MLPRALITAAFSCLALAAAPALASDDQDEEPPQGPGACGIELVEGDAGAASDEEREEDCPAPDGEDAGGAPGGDDGGACEPSGEGGAGGGEQPGGEGEPGPGDDAGEGAEGQDAGAGDAEEPDARIARLPAPTSLFRDFCEAPIFQQGFLRRSLRITGDAAGVRRGVLTVSAAATSHVPARFHQQAAQLADLDVAVVVGKRTRVAPARTARSAGKRGRRAGQRALRGAHRVRVDGRLLAPSRWRRDGDGLRVPTVRATRIAVLG